MFRKQIAHFQPKTEQEQTDKRLMLSFIRAYPDTVLTRENEFAHLTASSLIINPSFTHTLFVFHRLYQSWCWTGGHADGEHDLLSVAIKEAQEETGLKAVQIYSPDILSLDILPVFGHWKNGRYVATHLHFSAAFILLADQEAPLFHEKKENWAARWIPLSEIETYCREPHMLPIYQKLISRVCPDAIKT